ncbi:hypothetical protein BDF14DRAFT_1753944 [Spinellus fusiger]|nr:hypothetical protein BDF14DRAFT_1753944 [Spinellus fusiger]
MIYIHQVKYLILLITTYHHLLSFLSSSSFLFFLPLSMISVLPCKVKLLHFPRSLLVHATHAIVKTCFLNESTNPDHFFSFTENAYEVSIVADKDTIDQYFLPALSATHCQSIDTSTETYRVLQVDGEGGQDSSGKRINDLSSPLAQNKFSIFYMSTYQTDFVLIKERHLHCALQVLQDHGFEVEEGPDAPLFSPTPPPLAAATTPPSSPCNAFESYVLEDELRCVGLNPHMRSHYTTTLLKMICYPEMMPGTKHKQTRFFSYTASSDGISLVADRHVLDLFDEEQIFQDEDTQSYLRVIQVNLADAGLDRCGIVRSISHPLATEAHINLMYLSTFKSANILVSDSLGCLVFIRRYF